MVSLYNDRYIVSPSGVVHDYHAVYSAQPTVTDPAVEIAGVTMPQ